MDTSHQMPETSNYPDLYANLSRVLHAEPDVETQTKSNVDELTEPTAPIDDKSATNDCALRSTLCFHCVEKLDPSLHAFIGLACGHVAHVECVAEALARHVNSGLFNRDKSGRTFCYACNSDSAVPSVNTPKRAIVEKTFIDKFNQHAKHNFWSLAELDLELDECHALLGTSVFSMASFLPKQQAPIVHAELLMKNRQTFELMIQRKGVCLISFYRAGLSMDNLFELGFSPAQHMMPAYHRLVPPWQLAVLYYLNSDDLFTRCRIGTRIIGSWKLNAPEMFLLGLTAPLLMRHTIEKSTFLALPLSLEQWVKYLGLEPCHLVVLGVKECDFKRAKDAEYYRKFMHDAE